MNEELELMEIGKLTLKKDCWDWGCELYFEHTEVQQDPFYGDDDVESEITYEQAKELITHLQKFIDEQDNINN